MAASACGAGVHILSSLIERLRQRLAEPAGPAKIGGDWDFGVHGTSPPATVVPAAVLVPLVQRPQPGLILTTRTAHLRNHGGQVAFPGGRIDPEDRDAVQAALREAEEEIGLSRHVVDVLGIADSYQTGTGYSISPVVAVVPPDLPYVPSAHEVADLFEVPLHFALDPANHQLRETEWRGRMRRFYVIEHEGRSIWGATAAMLVNLSARL